jgi:hypothetical protein
MEGRLLQVVTFTARRYSRMHAYVSIRALYSLPSNGGPSQVRAHAPCLSACLCSTGFTLALSLSTHGYCCHAPRRPLCFRLPSPQSARAQSVCGWGPTGLLPISPPASPLLCCCCHLQDTMPGWSWWLSTSTAAARQDSLVHLNNGAAFVLLHCCQCLSVAKHDQ